MFDRDEVFDHSVRIEAAKSIGGPRTVRLDVYEFYWAPLTQRKASFAKIAHWLAATGFTPLRRLAFNLPLLIRRAENQAHTMREYDQHRLTSSGATPDAMSLRERLPPLRVLRQAKAAALGSGNFWLYLEFLHEIWRLIYVSLAAVGLAALAATLIYRASALSKQLPSARWRRRGSCRTS
jgi:hypothetical protein